MNTEEINLNFWHGSKDWDGRHFITVQNRKKYKKSSGVYLTNRLETAISYNENSDFVVLICLSPDARTLNDIKLNVEDIQEGLNILKQFKNNHFFNMFLESSKQRFFDGLIPLSIIFDELIDEESLSGPEGIVFSEWLYSKGVDVILEKVSDKETFVVLINPNIITKSKTFDLNTAKLISDFDIFETQKKINKLIKNKEA